MSYFTLLTRREGSVEYLTLNRPDVRNSLNEMMITELADWARAMHVATDVRAVVIGGAGKVFSAGADVTWMAKTATFSHDENVQDAMRTADMFAALNTLPMPVVGRVHGAALGGGAGLACVCDVVVADDGAMFGFTEVKLGIIPAVISPFAIEKIGRSSARALFLTGARFSAAHAKEIGLVHKVVSADALDSAVDAVVAELLSGGREAISAAKKLIATVTASPSDTHRELTSNAIAERRVSAEGQEGLTAFLHKRKPSWTVE